MSNTPEGGKKLREAMIARHGSVEAWKKYMSDLGKRGGAASNTGGFAYMKAHGMEDKIRAAGARGGRGKVKD